jgi:DNA-binding NarL/FixJ family response regulator
MEEVEPAADQVVMSLPQVRVLIVDDSMPIRDAVRSMLGMAERIVVVGEAVDGLDAIDQARVLEPDVVLMDIRMPNLGGLEASRVILQQAPGTRIVMHTTQTDVATMRAAEEIGVAQVVRKGASAAMIVAAVFALTA